MLQKVTAALASGSFPDIAYVFGSDLASVARSPPVVDLTDAVPLRPAALDRLLGPRRQSRHRQRAGAGGSRGGRLARRGLQQEALPRQAGLPLPEPGWTWDEFVDTAKKLTDAARGVFGTGWPGRRRRGHGLADVAADVGPGRRHHRDRTARSIGFADAGVPGSGDRAALAADKSVYIDPKPGSEQMYQVFDVRPDGHGRSPDRGSCPTSAKPEIDYHVVPLPTLQRRPVTISGPDTWTVFDNGPARVAGRPHLRALADATGPGRAAGTSARAACR